MTTVPEQTRDTTQLLDLVFAEVALREGLVSQEILETGISALQELGQAGETNRSLRAVLVDRDLVKQQKVHDAHRRMALIDVTCVCCGNDVPLKRLKPDGQLRCPRCETTLGVTVAEVEDAAGTSIEERLSSFVLEASALFASSKKKETARPTPAEEPPTGKRERRNAIKRFEIDSILHCGPFGRLYLATPGGGEGEFALKVFNLDALPDARCFDRLDKALAIWNQAAEESLRATHSLLEENCVHYLVRPYFPVPFQSLSDLRLTDQNSRERVLHRVTVEIAKLHAEGKEHGNLKPSNILLRDDGHLDHVFLVDPCLHQLLPVTNELARWSLLLKACRYRSPEETDGLQPTAASDVYSLGWIFYAVLAGTPPFVGIPPYEVLRRQREGPCPTLEDARWRDVVAHMTARKPAERPANAGEVLSCVEQVLDGKTYSAPKLTARSATAELDDALGVSKGGRFHPRYVVGPLLLAVALGWIGWCMTSWRDTLAIFGSSEDRPKQLRTSLAKDAFRQTRSAAVADPNAAQELWEAFLANFPSSPFAEEAQRGLDLSEAGTVAPQSPTPSSE